MGDSFIKTAGNDVVMAPTFITVAASDVLDERRRQIEGEGFDDGHDDDHDGGALAGAASAYALNAACLLNPFNGTPIDTPPESFPAGWSPLWWKPGKDNSGARRDLVKAGALILAEIERMDRAAERERRDNPQGGAS